MKQHATSVSLGIVLAILVILPAISQTPQTNAPPPAPAKKAPENLPWTRFHPATPAYQPTDAEKEQIRAKIDRLGGKVRELRSRRANEALLPDVEIYLEAAKWKMAYPEEFFRQKSVADTLAVLDQGL